MNENSKYLDKQNTQARILFIDFSSAFNYIQHVLLNKLIEMNVNSYLLI